MKLTDGKKTVKITMCIWQGSGYSDDFSTDFFNAGNLAYNAENDAYIVKDVDYCIEQANDWKECIADFSMESDPDNNRAVFIDEVETCK